MGYVLKAVLSSAQHPEYGQITVPFPIPDEKYDRMIELLEPLEIGDALRQDCRVDELDSFYTVLNRLVGSLVNFDELDYLAKRLDSFDDGEAAQFQGMACKLGVSNIKDFINLTFCCQQATVITDFSDLDAIGRQHYMTMQGGGCRIEELERLDGRKFALDLILNHLEGRITPYGVVYDNHVLKRILRSRRGEGYIDVCVLVLCAMLVIALAVQVLPAFIAKQQLDTFATELVREAEIAGRIGPETDRREQALREQTGLDPEIEWSDTGRIQLNEEVTVTLTHEIDLGLFAGFGSFPITLRADATGKSEVYWK